MRSGDAADIEMKNADGSYAGFRGAMSEETVVLLCRKAEQADRHIAVDYEPQGRHMEKRL